MTRVPYALSYNLEQVLLKNSVVQLTLLFGVNQEIKSDSEIITQDDHLEITHASGGKSIIPYSSILIITTCPKGSEPPSWHRERSQ